ncbi:hypothetical protein GGQ73_003588 [Rhizobium skierniewicense]|uniref:Uncharacterized protein n=1 Tax=Rhizobium skierniewicense TaxID=984260 RepID=A0A7W6C8H6_9HYPH|nr:hypothetical protein [Rhizobium skierniewicense]MBB3947620.1 hypothetical protein [Rhizobium skierniewicense]
MAKFIRNRLDEIQDRLGPTLRRIGHKPIARRSGTSFAIGLVPVKGNVFSSPVEIIFDDKSISGLSEASWKHAHMSEYVYSRRVLGDTGWESWKYHRETRHEIEGEGDAMFEWLSAFIDERELIPDATRAPNCLVNSNCGDAYLSLVQNFSDVEIERLPFLDGGMVVEALSFEDHEGREVNITMSAGSPWAPIYINQEKVAVFWQNDSTDLCRVILGQEREAGFPR